MHYKGYSGSVEYSSEDDCLYGKVLGIPKSTCITYEGDSVKELRKDFEGAVDDYLANCEARGVAPAKPYAGKILLRLTPDMHSMIASAAKSKGLTINEFVKEAVLCRL